MTSSMHPPQKAEAYQALISLKCKRSLEKTVKYLWPVLHPGIRLKWRKHHSAICQHMEAFHAGKITKLGIAIPPGQTKSTIVSIIYPLWSWLNDPTRRVISVAHTASLACEFQRERIKILPGEE